MDLPVLFLYNSQYTIAQGMDTEGNMSTFFIFVPDIENETIELASTADTDIASLSKRVPESNARYHLFNFPHTYEGDYLESLGMMFGLTPKTRMVEFYNQK